MNFRLPEKDSSAWRGLITAVEGFIGAIPVIVVAVYMAIKSVPGCDQAVLNAILAHVMPLAGSFGISAGTVSFLINLARKDVKNY